MSVEKDVLVQIINAGVRAPSGDNTQPWRFVVRGGSITVIQIPERDNPVYNFRGRGTLLAIGALLENMSIEAARLGFRARISIAADVAQSEIATLALEPGQTGEETPVSKAIYTRATNRKPYRTDALAGLSEVRQLQTSYGPCRIQFVESKKDKQCVARAVSTTERIMLGNETLHSSFFKEVSWSTEEEQRRKSGLLVDTLELAPPQQFVFAQLRHWSVARALGRMKFPAFIASQNALVYAKAAALGAIVVPNTDRHFITAGQLFERLWLEATARGWYVQPITAICYLGQRVAAGDAAMFSEEEKRQILAANGILDTLYALQSGETIAMVFRIGTSKPPRALSSRKEPEVMFVT